MKVELTPQITTQKIKLTDGVKNIVKKLKPLKNDTFEKQAAEKVEKKIIISRKHPNWCDMPEDGYRNNEIAKRVCYYPEDVEKMKSMTKEEVLAYKDYLDNIGRSYESDSSGSLKELESFLNRCGIKLEDVLIKDEK